MAMHRTSGPPTYPAEPFPRIHWRLYVHNSRFIIGPIDIFSDPGHYASRDALKQVNPLLKRIAERDYVNVQDMSWTLEDTFGNIEREGKGEYK